MPRLPTRRLGPLGLALVLVAATRCDGDTSSKRTPPAQPTPIEAAEPQPSKATERPPATADEDPAAPTSPDAPPVRKDGTIFADSELMGTRVSLNLFVGDASKAAAAGEAARAALDEMARLEQILSEWRPDSDLSQLSDAAGGPARPVVPELFEILERSVELAELTEGAFDPTFHGVGQLWSFGPGSVPPTREQVASMLPRVGWQKIELEPQTKSIRLREPGMKLGLGAIGKGYAADEASAVLTAKGFADHVVEVGGDTYASGTKDGKPWMVGIQRPDGPGALGAIPSRDQAVVTSGDYQRYFEHEGQRYSHILDPRTGWPIPAERSPKSVTLVASNATDADALCTAVAVMGVEDGMSFVEASEGIEAVIITQDDRMKISSGLRDQLILPPRPPEAPTPEPAADP